MPISIDTALIFFTSALFLSIAPGPDNLFVLTQSALYGARAGLSTCLGLMTGVCLHITAVTLGVAALLKASPTAFNIIKYIGAAYLLYLAWLTFKSGFSKKEDTPQAAFKGYKSLYKRGVLMNITNPKVCLFFLAILPGFVVPARGNEALQFISLGVLFLLAAFIIFAIISVLGGTLATAFNNSIKAQKILNISTICIFITLSAIIVFE